MFRKPRDAVSPDIFAEDFSVAVDFLGTTKPFVDRAQIGVISSCGSGSFTISATKIDPRLKAIATVSMHGMGAASRNALKHSLTVEQRKQIIADAAEQRYVEFTGGEIKYSSRASPSSCGRGAHRSRPSAENQSGPIKLPAKNRECQNIFSA